MCMLACAHYVQTVNLIILCRIPGYEYFVRVTNIKVGIDLSYTKSTVF